MTMRKGTMTKMRNSSCRGREQGPGGQEWLVVHADRQVMSRGGARGQKERGSKRGKGTRGAWRQGEHGDRRDCSDLSSNAITWNQSSNAITWNQSRAGRLNGPPWQALRLKGKRAHV